MTTERLYRIPASAPLLPSLAAQASQEATHD